MIVAPMGGGGGGLQMHVELYCAHLRARTKTKFIAACNMAFFQRGSKNASPMAKLDDTIIECVRVMTFEY